MIAMLWPVFMSNLIFLVEALDLPQGLTRSLTARLSTSLRQLERANERRSTNCAHF
jgi:hypothetical protein